VTSLSSSKGSSSSLLPRFTTIMKLASIPYQSLESFEIFDGDIMKAFLFPLKKLSFPFNILGVILELRINSNNL
jgi:hypothetical protein